MTTLFNQLKIDEGCVKNKSGLHIPYRDSEGYLTIGYGALIDEDKGGGLYEEEAEFILRNRIKLTERELLNKYPWMSVLTPPQWEAVTNMAFNLGVPTFSQFKNMLASLEARDFEAAAEHAKDSKWYRQVGKRADRIIEKIRNK